MLHMEKAFVSTLKKLSGAIRDDAQVWEARNLSRQPGYTHMGLVMTAKELGFVQDPSRVCPAATREAGFVVLGAEEKKFALCKKPTDFRTFYKEVEAAEKVFIPVFFADGPANAHDDLQHQVGKGAGQGDWIEELEICGAAREQETFLAHGTEIWRLLLEQCPDASSAASRV